MHLGLWRDGNSTSTDALVDRLRIDNLKIKQYEDALAHEQRINEEYRNILARYEDRARILLKVLCPSECVSMQIGGKGLDDMPYEQVVATVEKCVTEQNRAQSMEIADLRRRLETALAQAAKFEEELRSQNNRRLTAPAASKPEPEPSPSIKVNTTAQDQCTATQVESPVAEMPCTGIPDEQRPGVAPLQNTQSQPHAEEPAGDVAANGATDVSERAKIVLYIMGAKGYSRLMDIRGATELINETGRAVQDALAELTTAGLVRTFNLANGAPGRPYTIATLTEAGEDWYRSVYHRQPVASQHDMIVAQHASAEHGWAIYDAGSAMEKCGYEVTYDRAKLRFKTPTGKEVNADLVARRDGDVRLIEVETGTSSQEDIDHKLDKLYEIQQTFWIVCPNKAALDTIKEKVYQWIGARGGRSAFERLVLSFATISMLANDEWSTTVIGGSDQTSRRQHPNRRGMGK